MKKKIMKSLESLLGEQVILFCNNYFYAGLLEGVNDKWVLLADGKIVYETGEFSATQWKDAQLVAEELFVNKCSIESFCRSDK